MPNVTRILLQIEQGDPSAVEQLLPILYDELRVLAAAKLAHEDSGQTLQATALVHEAYLRLVGSERPQHWNSRGHFFGAAAEAMRRILVEDARRKSRKKRGGDAARVDIEAVEPVEQTTPAQLILVDDALSALEANDPEAGALAKLRYFAGFSVEEAAEMIGLPRSTAYQHWSYAKAWMRRHLQDDTS